MVDEITFEEQLEFMRELIASALVVQSLDMLVVRQQLCKLLRKELADLEALVGERGVQNE